MLSGEAIFLEKHDTALAKAAWIAVQNDARIRYARLLDARSIFACSPRGEVVMDLKTLERMTVVKLREEALKIPELSGVRAKSKDELIRALAGALGIDLGERRRGGGSMPVLKRQIRDLKMKIAEVIQSKKSSELRTLRRQVKHLKTETRRLAREKRPAEKASATPAGADAAASPPAA
jgi:hypothetical protein